MLRHVASVGGLTLLSRAVGFVRDVLMAALLGAGPVADAFFVAFRIPNHFRALFAEGAFTAAFVPVYAGLLRQRGPRAAMAFAEDAGGWLLATQAVLLAAFLATTPAAMRLFAPGFADTPEIFALSVAFARLTFPYLLFMTLVVLLTGMLNAHRHFAAGAAAPVLLNLCLIAALLLLVPHTATAGHALAWGVFAAGILQLVFLAAAAQAHGLELRLRRPRLTPEVRRFLAALGPAALGAGVVQVSLFLDTLIASFLPAGSVSYLYYADRLNQLPLGVIGITIGTVLLPELARRHAGGEDAEARRLQNAAVIGSLALALPCAAAFLVIAEPLMLVLFQRGAFGPEDAAAAAATLGAYALGVPAFVLVRVFAPGFQARGDTATPVKAACIGLALNVALKLVLVGTLAQVGLALATSAGAWVTVGLLVWWLHRRGLAGGEARLWPMLGRVLLAVAAMAAVLWLATQLLAAPLHGGVEIERAAALGGLVAAGLATYLVALWPLGLLRALPLSRRGGRQSGG